MEICREKPLHDGEDRKRDNGGRERYRERELSYCWEIVIKASTKAREPRGNVFTVATNTGVRVVLTF